MQKWIVQVDMDAFFAAIEQRDNPELIGKPVIVGGTGGRGVVSTASYEARRFGVHSAMPMAEARRRCSHGVFLPCDHHKYRSVSAEIGRILSAFSPLVEPLSLDEAFLDVTGMELLYPDPAEIAAEIKAEIKVKTGLTASAGVAPNKFLAKLASDLKKPDGLVVIRPGEEKQFLRDLPVLRLWGIGQASARILESINIKTIGQLAEADPRELVRHFGKSAYELRKLANGEDNRPVISGNIPHSIGKEITFEANITDWDGIEAQLLALSEKVGWRLRRSGYSGRTISVKIRFASFKTITRSQTLTEPTCLDDTIYQYARRAAGSLNLEEGVRLLGITVSNLQDGCGLISLFDSGDEKRLAVSAAVDRLKAKFGEAVITRGRLIGQ